LSSLPRSTAEVRSVALSVQPTLRITSGATAGRPPAPCGHISPSKTTLIGLSTPALTIIPAFFVFGTVPVALELVGSAIMIAGIAIPVLERQQGMQALASTR